MHRQMSMSRKLDREKEVEGENEKAQTIGRHTKKNFFKTREMEKKETREAKKDSKKTMKIAINVYGIKLATILIHTHPHTPTHKVPVLTNVIKKDFILKAFQR